MVSRNLLLYGWVQVIYVCTISYSKNVYNLNLPTEHIPLYFNNHPKASETCQMDLKCPYKMHLGHKVCWGYEDNCSVQDKYIHSVCPGDHKGWVNNKKEQIELFNKQGDFGYVEERRNSLEKICAPMHSGHSYLSCSQHLQFCVGKHIWMNLTDLVRYRHDSLKYSTNVLKHGDIGAACRLDRGKLKTSSNHHSSLQSWSPELQNFVEMAKDPIGTKLCDVVINKPAIIMKLDATVSMYHHFCDFFNLYASLHVNNSEENTFTTDTQIIIWDNSPYRSNFLEAFKPFSKNPLMNLGDLMGKKVCFRNLMLPMPPRMIFGLYYNTPLISGCYKSGLFHAFNRFMLHRMKIPYREKIRSDVLKVIFLSRKTQYRRVLNEEELIAALKRKKSVTVERVAYHWDTDFKDQVNTTHHADIFIGLHGSGLTHLLFLPDWAVVVELHNCGDEHCYLDLARLRGVEYMTWQDQDKVKVEMGQHPELKGPHPKFANYIFDTEAFLRLMARAEARVRSNRAWRFARGYTLRDEL